MATTVVNTQGLDRELRLIANYISGTGSVDTVNLPLETISLLQTLLPIIMKQMTQAQLQIAMTNITKQLTVANVAEVVEDIATNRSAGVSADIRTIVFEAMKAVPAADVDLLMGTFTTYFDATAATDQQVADACIIMHTNASAGVKTIIETAIP